LEKKQIGFVCYANYNPKLPRMVHANRLVIHPDYQGFGIGIKFINIASEDVVKKGYKVRSKFSSYPNYVGFKNSPNWLFIESSNNFEKSMYKSGGSMINKFGHRQSVKTYTFKFLSNNKLKLKENKDEQRKKIKKGKS
jgi:GNAT superfamily N-acetyltransferase